ncbi:MAG: Crp/Fnr family transcriptional regulator, partial [Bacteroidota bacterium]|nr:Crp/Fnr family transcriptional regulator [Bacteroidota bacterium]
PYKSTAFQFLKNDEIDLIQQNCLTVHFKKRENICKQNLNVTHALYLSKGMVKVFIEGEKKNSIIDIVTEGQYIGLQSSFNDSKYNFSVTALEESRICMVDLNVLNKLCSYNPTFLMEITKIISNCTNKVFKRIAFCNKKSVRAKLAHTILWLAETIYKSNDFKLNLSRQELANYIGISRENTVRTITEFRKEGLISTNGKNVQIIQKDILNAMANID